MPLLLLRRLFPSVALLLVAIFIRESTINLSLEYQQILNWMPYATLGLAMVLCINYNHARLFTISLALLLIYYFIQSELQVSLNEFRAHFIYSAISILLPITLLLFFFLPERGLRNRYGILIILTVPLLFLISLTAFKVVSEVKLMEIMNDYFLLRPFENYLLSINATIIYFFALVAGLYRLCKTDNEYYSALLSVLAFSFIVLAYFSLQKISVVMLSIAGISLIVSLMRGALDMAYRDDLTGLLGRRALNERLKGLAKPYVIAMADVDHFKNFNDTHGHDIGDEVLKMVARKIGAVKGGGTAYRYGGEEFCMVFSGKNIEYSKPFLDVVRTDIEAYKMALRDIEHRSKSAEKAKQRRGRRGQNRAGKTVSVTISIGFAEANDKYIKADEVLKAADTALYKAKNNGRNCLATI